MTAAFGDLGWQVHTETTMSSLRTTAHLGAHAVVADEPVELGGTNEGAPPTHLLLASLGSCTTITLQLYAKRKGWPLESAVVQLRLLKRESGAARATIERSVELVGPLTEEQRARLMEISERCPVHRMITEGMIVQTVAEA